MTSGREIDPQRILLLGDSFVWGLGIRDDGILDRQMDNLLGPDYEVVNTGIPGYGPDQEALYYIERGAAFQAAALILFLFTDNDFSRTSLPPSGTSTRNRSSCSSKRGARLLVIAASPRRALARLGADKRDRHLERISLIEEVGRRAGFPVRDLLGELGEALHRGELPFYRHDIHWNPLGHKIAARAAVQSLRQLGCGDEKPRERAGGQPSP